MFDYFKYLLSPVILGVHAYGLWLGGHYAWLGLGCMLVVLFFDGFLENDYSMRDQRQVWIYDVIVSLTVLASFANMCLYAWLAGGEHFATTSAAVGAFVGTAFIGFVVHAPPVHELFHRENRLLRTLGRVGQCLIFDPWREITHVVTHHMRVATPDDPDYARRGDTVYGHILRTFPGQWRESYHLEKMMWTKRGRAWYDPRNAWVLKAGYLVAFTAILFALGGAKGTVLAVFSILVGPRMMLEVFNYCNHYGLVSATPGRFQKHHTWNHLTPMVRILALEITNHAGHHDDSYKPFYQLEPDREGPKQPQFLLCVLLAFVPPLFFLMIKPLLRHWDRHYASPQELEIARAENARAGWHDLNEDEAVRGAALLHA
ncbi:MAG TPA: fatty acid desaturase [Solimonas sp.]|nr:fatty acid desaturase [Solimonas sp.]